MEISVLRKKAINALKNSKDLRQLDKAQKIYLGKKGEIGNLLKTLKTLPTEKRRKLGTTLNHLKVELLEIYRLKNNTFKEQSAFKKEKEEKIDITLPGRTKPTGTSHPITTVIKEVSNFFEGLGFQITSGPEVESDYYNFEALNIPSDHPAKDMHDTFYLDNGLLLRTHTSPVQIRTMEKEKPPIRIICPGKVYRKDSDLTHTPMYHNIEGLVVEKGVSFATLKGLIKDFLVNFFNEDVELRFRPSYFPFTEPSAEVDIKWKKGWLEVMGCGMVHPNVLRMAGVDLKSFPAFAFGLGPERLAMLRYEISDLRDFFQNDIRFLRQFR